MKRRESLVRELASAPTETPRPKTILFFAGGPVAGSLGIDAYFASEVLAPFLEMVKTQYSAQTHGPVGARGPRRGEAEARLMLTGLPRGSFGLELSQIQPEDFIASEQLRNVLARLTEVIAAAAGGREAFAASLKDISTRVIPNLKKFFNVVAEHQASLGMETGAMKFTLSLENVRSALELVGSAQTVEKPVELEGVFRGATLDSWRFDFRLQDGETISGRIGENVEDSVVAEMVTKTNKVCKARFNEITVSINDVTKNIRYELLGLNEPPP